MSSPETPLHRWIVPVIVTIGLASIGGIAWAARSGQRAEDAYTMAKSDHDTIVELKTLVPILRDSTNKLEATVTRLEAAQGGKGAGK